jgi:deoxyribodipyrimidine photolyase-related protein
MILGSTMFMCDVQASKVYRYFMEMFVDAAEWVMEPNVYGMSQFVPPTFATKPYISGSAYVLKMSDYPKGEWCAVWDGLYWRTVDRLKDRLAQNHRMTPILRGLDRLDPDRRERIFREADAFIQRTTLPVREA